MDLTEGNVIFDRQLKHMCVCVRVCMCIYIFLRSRQTRKHAHRKTSLMRKTYPGLQLKRIKGLQSGTGDKYLKF